MVPKRSDRKVCTPAVFMLVLMVAALGAFPARAIEPILICDRTDFPASLANASLAVVTEPRLAIWRDDDGCPESGERCASKAYLVKNDVVVAAQTRGEFRCVAFPGGRVQTTGWVRQSALADSDAAMVGDWAGDWERETGSATLTIRRHGARYTADAEATAVSAGNPNTVSTGIASGDLIIQGARASFGDGGSDRSQVCRVDILRLGPLLLVNDGGTSEAISACDGMGVTLDGIYRRAAAHPKR